MARVVLDSSVIVEYLDENGLLHEQAQMVFSAILSGRLEAVVPHPILAETYYVATRIYQETGKENPQETASKLVQWIYNSPPITIAADSLDLALEAGKTKLHYGLALTDCYVLGCSKTYSCPALFRKPETEMQEKMDTLKKEYPILFLKDYA